MKANELRIGNYYNHNGEILKITPNDIQEVWEAERSWCKPIPLTDEWLIKFGLGKQNGYPYKFLNGYLKIRNGVYFFKFYGLEVELPFVHSIQNFNFALTGEELKLKEDSK